MPLAPFANGAYGYRLSMNATLLRPNQWSVRKGPLSTTSDCARVMSFNVYGVTSLNYGRRGIGTK